MPSDKSEHRETAEYRVCGLDCAEEVGIIRRRLDGEPGIEELRFDVMRGKLTAAFDPRALTAEDIAAQVSALGLECRPWEEPAREIAFFERRGQDLLTGVSSLALALGFKLLFLGLAARNLATLWLAVAADMGATLVVIFNGLRLLRRPGSRTE